MNIAIYAGWLHQWELAGPACFWEDIPSPAGTELSIYGTSEALARCGHSVTVYMPGPTGKHGLVEYMDPRYFVSTARLTRYDVVVAIHDSRIFGIPFEAGLKVTLAPSQSLLLPPGVQVDRYFACSNWSIENVMRHEPCAERERFWVTRNGQWLERYGWLNDMDAGWVLPEHRRMLHNPTHLVWASSPDRGLWHMAHIFPEVKKHIPEATLTVAYNFQKFEASCTHEPTLELLRRAHPLFAMPGVEFVEHLSQPKLAQLLMRGGILVYPGDVGESYACIINEAMCAGLPVIATANGAVPELYGRHAQLLSHPIHHDEWVDALIATMTSTHYRDEQEVGYQLARVTDFSEIAVEWTAFFTDYFAGRTTTIDRGLRARLDRNAS